MTFLFYVYASGLKGNSSNNTVCKTLTRSDYLHILWTTCADFPGKLLPVNTISVYVLVTGTLWSIVILLLLGRKLSLAITALASAGCYGLLFLCIGKWVAGIYASVLCKAVTAMFYTLYLSSIRFKINATTIWTLYGLKAINCGFSNYLKVWHQAMLKRYVSCLLM